MSLAAVRPQPSPAWDPNDRSLWTVQECAEFLGLSKCGVYRLVEAGEVPFVRLGARTLRFVPSRIRAWVADRESGNELQRRTS